MKRPRILIFIDWYLPGYRSGGPTRSCANLISHLKNDFDFSVITRNTDYMSSVPYPDVKSNEWNILPDGTRVYYFSADRLSKDGIYDLLRNEKYDKVYLNGIFSKYFTLIPLQYFRGKKNKNVIVAGRGMLAESALAIKKWKKLLFLFFAKKISLFKGVIFHATNEEEAASIMRVFGKRAQVRIAINLAEISDIAAWKQKGKVPGSLRLVSVARIAPEKNIKFALEVLREVKDPVQFDLYGPLYDEKYWGECKEVIEKLPANIKVSFKDSLSSEKVASVIAGYDFLFLPTRGENFGHVILQAMSAGLPVIISDKTMWRQLEDKKAGWDISLSQKKEFSSVIERCAKMDGQEYAIYSKGAFDLAKSYFNNKELIEQSRQLFLK